MLTQAPPYATGVIHGRFQVLHNDHLRYLLAGKACCRHLVVGITNPDPLLTKPEAVDPGRSDPLENPLTYYERHIMVSAALRAAGLDWDEFTIVPFPINLPERYPYYVPMDAVFFLTIYDDWGRCKLQYFQSMGLATHILWKVASDQKGISAKEIRQRMITDQPWDLLVPACVVPLMIQWGIPERLKRIQENKGEAIWRP